jgi:hypothetical protein
VWRNVPVLRTTEPATFRPKDSRQVKKEVERTSSNRYLNSYELMIADMIKDKTKSTERGRKRERRDTIEEDERK